MANYVDGFVLPIPRQHLDEYQRVAQAVAEIWREQGALDYREFVGNDLQLEGVRDFPGMVSAGEDEVIVFGWVSFASKAARDRANEKVATDPRMPGLVDAADTGFDASRMAWGGFRPLVT